MMEGSHRTPEQVEADRPPEGISLRAASWLDMAHELAARVARDPSAAVIILTCADSHMEGALHGPDTVIDNTLLTTITNRNGINDVIGRLVIAGWEEKQRKPKANKAGPGSN